MFLSGQTVFNRGSIANTIISNNVSISNQVNIGHNVNISESTLFHLGHKL